MLISSVWFGFFQAIRTVLYIYLAPSYCLKKPNHTDEIGLNTAGLRAEGWCASCAG